MPQVVVAPAASDALEALIRTHSLPADTRKRVARSLRRLERFPELGRELTVGRWSGYRVILGPWRWLIILYKLDADAGTVMVPAFEDGRSSAAATTA